MAEKKATQKQSKAKAPEQEQETQSKPEQRSQQVVARKRTYFVPGQRRSVEAKNGRDLESVVKGGNK